MHTATPRPLPSPDSRRARSTVSVGAILLATLCATNARAEPSRFDGAWDVTIDCPSNSEPSNAKGYTYRFPAIVRDGALVGGRGKADEPGSLHVEGPIADDGSAMLQATGRTGDPAYAARHPSFGSPYGYRIKAQFDEARGTGTRLEARACSFVFVRR